VDAAGRGEKAWVVKTNCFLDSISFYNKEALIFKIQLLNVSESRFEIYGRATV